MGEQSLKNGGDIERPTISELSLGNRSICLTLDVEKLLTIWNPCVDPQLTLILDLYLLALQLRHGVLCGMCCTAVKMEQMATKFQNGCFL